MRASRWTAVEVGGQLTITSIMHERAGQHLILGGDFNASFYGLTDFHHVRESIPRPKTLTGTNDSLRARALHTVVAELDLTVTNTWMDANLRTRTIHKEQLDGTRGRTDADVPNHGVEEAGTTATASAAVQVGITGQVSLCCD